MRILTPLLLLVCACGFGTDDAKPPAPPAVPGDTGPTGRVSEEAFKALHELSGEERPEPAGRWIELGEARAYLSLPEGASAPLPGVVLIHEWWGLNRHILHWADRLAHDGYAALAVDLYGGEVAETREDAMRLMKGVDAEKALATLRAAHAFLKDDARVKAPRRACVGWCFGGAWSLQLAMAAPDLDLAVIYYGRLVTDPDKLRSIRAELLGVFGNDDPSIPPETVDEFEAALGEAGVTHTILRYDAPHAFANPSSARYVETAAADAWERVRAALARRLRGSG